MSESLQVIALISGGKDSIFSILHCIQNGHKVIALANLHPPLPLQRPNSVPDEDENEDDPCDLNSFMYQTVGHTVIPLYEESLGIPLYRQPIAGSAKQTGTSYSHADIRDDESAEEADETESLIPLLKRIMKDHPTVNAISTGAILSTYQRTRVESVALRLGLTPLSFLWKYPILPPDSQASLLRDMQAVSLDARLIKVASGGLDESFLWENVASEKTIVRIEKAVKRFGMDGDGAVLGEGGEFETLVVDGPRGLFGKRIEIEEKARRVVREGGGSAWLQIEDAKIVEKYHEGENEEVQACRVPDLLDRRFEKILGVLKKDKALDQEPVEVQQDVNSAADKPWSLESVQSGQSNDGVLYWTIVANASTEGKSIADEAESLVRDIKHRLYESSLATEEIVSTTIILRSMQDFAVINKVYGSLFSRPNPPSRVTISCGDCMPLNTSIIIHLKLQVLSKFPASPLKKALHVQSRSYWAPANIGPYSQAISIPVFSPPSSSEVESQNTAYTVNIAGQIPLIPHTMLLPSTSSPGGTNELESELDNFKIQTVLSLQHLFRIGIETSVQWFASAVAYLPKGSTSIQARVAGRAWRLIHALPKELSGDEDDDVEEHRDLWEEKHLGSGTNMGSKEVCIALPDWDIVEGEGDKSPPVWAVEVDELPRGSAVEWHTHLGIVGSRVKTLTHTEENAWSCHSCLFGSTKRVVIKIYYPTSNAELSNRIQEACGSAGMRERITYQRTVSYIDVQMVGIVEGLAGAVVPCRKIWDEQGRRLSVVLMFDV